MRYLILDKKQRLKKDDKGLASADLRIFEELDKKGIEYNLVHFDELEFEFLDGETSIKAKGIDIKEYSHIIFRGHSLHNPMEYEIKRYIIDYIDQYNLNNPKQKVLIQNSEAIKRFPYYNKIAMAIICSQNKIPYFNTYFRTDGRYSERRNMLNEYPLIMKEYAGVNRVQIIDGEEKIKKNVFKIDNEEGYQQENLADQDHSRFFLQEFSDTGEDMRIFVKLGKVIAGWRRKTTDSFMTVSHGEYLMYNSPDQEIRELSEKVAQLFGADFMAVDIMYIHGKPHLQEFSFHPGFKAYETKIEGEHVNIAEAIITAFKD